MTSSLGDCTRPEGDLLCLEGVRSRLGGDFSRCRADCSRLDLDGVGSRNDVVRRLRDGGVRLWAKLIFEDCGPERENGCVVAAVNSIGFGRNPVAMSVVRLTKACH